MADAVNQPFKIVIVDDHKLFRAGLLRVLESHPGLKVCGEFGSAEEVLESLAAGMQFDAILVDYELLSTGGARTSGLDLVSSIRALRPEANILMVTAGMRASELSQAIYELKVGVFLKSESEEELILAVSRTTQGQRWVSTQAALSLVPAKSPVHQEHSVSGSFTPKEEAVLQGILEGLSNKEIGAKLDVTEGAIKTVLQRLFDKVGVRTRSQLVRYAIESRSGKF